MSGIVRVFSSKREEIIPDVIRRISQRDPSEPEIWSGPAGSLGAIWNAAIHENPGPITNYGFNNVAMYFAYEIKSLLGFADQILGFPPGTFWSLIATFSRTSPTFQRQSK